MKPDGGSGIGEGLAEMVSPIQIYANLDREVNGWTCAKRILTSSRLA